MGNKVTHRHTVKITLRGNTHPHMEYRTNRVNSICSAAQEVERVMDPCSSKISSAQTEISKKKIRKNFLKKKIRATEFPMHEISGVGARATSRTPGDRFFRPPGPYASEASQVRDVRYGRRTLDRD